MSKDDKKVHFVLDVDLIAHWPDTSFLGTSSRFGVPLPRHEHRLDAEDVVTVAVTRAESLLQSILNAKFKTRPNNYVLSLSLSAYYPDGREADRRSEPSETDPDQIVSRVERWYKENLQALVDIGADET